MYERQVGEYRVVGLAVDEQTRCAHWYSERDVVAMRFGCCSTFYPCHSCHEACANHPPTVWPYARRDEAAVLCGGCGHAMTVESYINCDSRCPACAIAFNPGCAAHYPLYFDPLYL
jgi:uncharacterized CHY-type Zn-finger protein